MAKKSTKSTRRTRAARTSKQTSAQEAAAPRPAETTATVPPRDEIAGVPVEAETPVEVERAVEESLQPQRRRMIVNSVVLGMVMVVLLLMAAVMRQQHDGQTQTARSGQSSAAADKLLEDGGSVCAAGAQTDSVGSTNPQSVGMMLQNVPSNTIQTPEALSPTSSDGTTLQGASCF